MTSPIVTVVVLARNSEKTIHETLSSLLNQTLVDMEILVIDGGSKDRTLSIVKSFNDSRISILLQTGTGIRAAREQALHAVQTDLVAYLDSDDVAHPERLQKQFDFLKSHPDCACVGSWIELIGQNGEHIAFRSYPVESAEIIRAFSRYNPIANPSVMFRREVAITAGGYESFLVEDYDLWIRVAKAGHFHNLPEYLVKYRIHPGGSKMGEVRKQNWASIKIRWRHWRAGCSRRFRRGPPTRAMWPIARAGEPSSGSHPRTSVARRPRRASRRRSCRRRP